MPKPIMSNGQPYRKDGKMFIDVTIRRDTRPVEVEPSEHTGWDSVEAVAYVRFPKGNKIWPVKIYFRDVNGKAVVIPHQYRLGRWLRILGWDEEKFKKHHSQHRGA
jgi:hypothetical protein